MKTNWMTAVNTVNSKRYTVPAGWENKEQVAVSLQCDPSKVPDILKPGIQAGDFEKQDFMVWDDRRRIATKVTHYRVATGERMNTSTCNALPPVGTDERRVARIREALARFPGQTAGYVARKLFRVSREEVEAVMDLDKTH